MLEKALKLTETAGTVPEVQLKIAAPGRESDENTFFEQIFQQLHGKQSLTVSESKVSRGDRQLWKTKMSGDTAVRLIAPSKLSICPCNTAATQGSIANLTGTHRQ